MLNGTSKLYDACLSKAICKIFNATISKIVIASCRLGGWN